VWPRTEHERSNWEGFMAPAATQSTAGNEVRAETVSGGF